MRKIHKITNIALIFTLIGVFLCQNLAYAENNSLRVPSSFQDETKDFPGKFLETEDKIAADKSGHGFEKKQKKVIIDIETGAVERSFFRLSSKEFSKLHKKTVKDFRLKDNGRLFIGAKSWATFTKYPSHQIEIDVEHGVITEVRVYDEKGQLIKEKDSPNPDRRAGHHRFSIIIDKATGNYEDSFRKALVSAKLKKLHKKTIKGFRLDDVGTLTIGGSHWTEFAKHPNHLVEIDLERGVISEVRIYNEKGGLINSFLFKKVIDEENRAVFSFRNNYIPSRVWEMLKKTGKARIIWGKLSEWNAMKVNRKMGSEYFDFTSVGDFAGKDLVIHFEYGNIDRFEIKEKRGTIKTILVEDVQKESGLRVISQIKTAFEVSGGEATKVIAVDEEATKKVTLGLLKEAAVKALKEAGYNNADKLWDILMELGEIDDTEDNTSEEIVAKKNDINPRDILNAVQILSGNKIIREYLLGVRDTADKAAIKYDKSQPGQTFASNEKINAKIIKLLSSDNTGEIDRGLRALDALQNPDDIVKIVDSVFAGRDLRLEIYDKVTAREMPAIRIVNIRDGGDIVGRCHFFPSTHKLLEFYSTEIEKEELRGKRLFPLMLHWIIAHPYFQTRCFGWDIRADRANARAARVFWSSRFDDIKIVTMVSNEEIKGIEEINGDKMFTITGKFPEIRLASNLSINLQGLEVNRKKVNSGL